MKPGMRPPMFTCWLFWSVSPCLCTPESKSPFNFAFINHTIMQHVNMITVTCKNRLSGLNEICYTKRLWLYVSKIRIFFSSSFFFFNRNKRKIMRIFALPPTVGSSPEPNFYDSLQKVRLRQQLEMYSLGGFGSFSA